MSGAFAVQLIVSQAALGRGLPDGFVYLRDVDAGIAQDMRYAGPDNFTGHAVPGYGAAECVLRREAAEALARVQVELARKNLKLKVYDCYRPKRAVRAFARWAQTPAITGAREPTKKFYPAIEKRALFALGYIAAHSVHSSGNAVDLTLVPLASAPLSSTHSLESGNPHSQSAIPCTASADQRARDNLRDNSLDMGTGFDCFDQKSHTASRAITPAQARSRALLVAAMRAHGFHNYFREWWHFDFGGRRRRSYDFPIGPR